MQMQNSSHNSLVLSVLAVLLVGGLIGNGFALMSYASKNIPVQTVA